MHTATHTAIVIPPPVDSDATLRFVALGETGYRLHTWDAGRSIMGKDAIGYALYGPADTAPIFIGEDIGASPLHAVDSDETLRAVLTFLTLRPGDTDDEYFERYTNRQRAFADSDAEYLSLWADDEIGEQFTDLRP